jgi:hypothetical protein
LGKGNQDSEMIEETVNVMMKKRRELESERIGKEGEDERKKREVCLYNQTVVGFRREMKVIRNKMPNDWLCLLRFNPLWRNSFVPHVTSSIRPSHSTMNTYSLTLIITL